MENLESHLDALHQIRPVNGTNALTHTRQVDVPERRTGLHEREEDVDGVVGVFLDPERKRRKMKSLLESVK